MVKREEEDDLEIHPSPFRSYIAREITPIITIQRKPSTQAFDHSKLVTPSPFKQEKVMEVQINHVPAFNSTHGLMDPEE